MAALGLIQTDSEVPPLRVHFVVLYRTFNQREGTDQETIDEQQDKRQGQREIFFTSPLCVLTLCAVFVDIPLLCVSKPSSVTRLVVAPPPHTVNTPTKPTPPTNEQEKINDVSDWEGALRLLVLSGAFYIARRF